MAIRDIYPYVFLLCENIYQITSLFESYNRTGYISISSPHDPNFNAPDTYYIPPHLLARE